MLAYNHLGIVKREELNPDEIANAKVYWVYSHKLIRSMCYSCDGFTFWFSFELLSPLWQGMTRTHPFQRITINPIESIFILKWKSVQGWTGFWKQFLPLTYSPRDWLSLSRYHSQFLYWPESSAEVSSDWIIYKTGVPTVLRHTGSLLLSPSLGGRGRFDRSILNPRVHENSF